MKLFGLQEVNLDETCNKVRTVKYLSDVYPTKFGLKQEGISALFRFIYALIYAIAEVQANQKFLK